MIAKWAVHYLQARSMDVGTFPNNGLRPPGPPRTCRRFLGLRTAVGHSYRIATVVTSDCSYRIEVCLLNYQFRRCREISLDISIIDVFPVNSNFTLPSDEK